MTIVRLWIGVLALAAFWLPWANLAAGQNGPQEPPPADIKAAKRVLDALTERLGRIKTLSMRASGPLVGLGGGGTETITFPPGRHRAKEQDDQPKTIFQCFQLDGPWRYDRVSHGKFHGKPATILEHFPLEGADSYNVLYISDRTGWPLACGYSLDTAPPMLTVFTHIHVTLRRRR